MWRGMSLHYSKPHCVTDQSSQEICFADTDGAFDACATNDLACLCSLDQSEVTRYVDTVQPCIDGDAGREACTAGAIYRESCHRDI
jgi:hypothetical protein